MSAVAAAVEPEVDTVVEEEEIAFDPKKITTINPDGAMVDVAPDGSGAVRLSFVIFATQEVFNINITGMAAAAIREKIPASSVLLTPPKPSIILP